VDTQCAAMQRLMEQVRRLAPLDTTLLLAGETGTGKTRLARLIHDLSRRRGQPFLVINCGALAETLMESEMFGHTRGAFTGADRDRTGKFAEAGSGTLLLDDIDALSLTLQAKLLQAVEERVFVAVGSNQSLPVQARLIAASNRPLEQEIRAGRFRSDLYYRLSVVALYLPPLREQTEMVPQLATEFLRKFAERAERPIHGITVPALCVLQSYHWPGNIRELRNVIERAVALCSGPEIGVDDLPESIYSAVSADLTWSGMTEHSANGARTASILQQTRQEAEVARIVQTLRKHGNNRSRAALELGISRRTLYKKLHVYGLMRNSEKPAAI
jgi:DNA-binding NtrC family response regulator